MSDLPATVATTSPATYDREKLRLIRDMCAKGATDNEFLVMMELANRYQLDPFSKQIWLVKYGDSPAQIFCGRDGYLAIAHRSGQFDGMESGTRKEGDDLVGWCKVYRKDMSHPFEVEVYASEYSTGKNLWRDKPRTMIQKVAEAQCLRRAFSISGLYSPEEIDTGDRAPRYVGEVPPATPTACEVCGIPVPEDIREKTKPHTDRVLCIEHFSEWWNAQKEVQA
ncbi:MAG TPA: phage recombination protein Bet [Methanoculleus sp.]|nr:phage recombination protein Bet [Methanoculleus sp.]